ncbi:MAG TPA: carbohydrate kinase family protein [Microvirga sp.]|nr:carbohydrate kinase family protein [Microvirga sp.]
MSARSPSIACIGGATVDRTYRACASLAAGTSNPVIASARAFGGVARNVAETLARLQVPAALVSIVGDDEAGRDLATHLSALGIAARIAVDRRHRTAEYVAVLQPSGELAFGLADMAIFDALTGGVIDDAWPLLAAADWVFADCNLPAETLQRLLAARGEQASFKLAVDAVSTHKAARLPQDLAGVDLLFANRDEARAIGAAGLRPEGSDEAFARGILARGAGAVVVTLGAQGALAATGTAMAALPAVAAEIVDVTGAGDALIAGTLSELLQGATLPDALATGLLSASLTVESPGSVRPDLSPGLLQATRHRIQALCRSCEGLRP